MTTPAETYFLARKAHRQAGQELFQKTAAHVAALVDSIPPEERTERLSLILTAEITNSRWDDEAARMLIEALAEALKGAASLSQFKRHTLTIGA